MSKKLILLTILSLLFSDLLFAQSNLNPRIRVISDNDYAGDPDGLFQLTHLLLSPSVEIAGIIGSHLREGDPFDSSNETATHAVENVHQLIQIANLKNSPKVFQGSNRGLMNTNTPNASEAATFIVKEAMRTDTSLPLYVICGGGLTEIATAYLLEPKIAEKITLIWIGGTEYDGLAYHPPGYSEMEYNTGIDPVAVQVIFNDSAIKIWQVPRNAYRESLMSYTELQTRVKPNGALGNYLFQKIDKIFEIAQKANFNLGETYIMGDNPLVLLTALQSSFEPDPSSSFYTIVKAPFVNKKGLYEKNDNGREIRIYDHLDNRLMLEDFYLKLQLNQQN